VADIVVDPVAPESKKEDPLDFALWKRSKEGEPSWPSPWGGGRPGWHVECNAMAFKYLGAPLDIHGGGLDLKFPHHESEAMICEGALGAEWARTWMHNGFLTLQREKMSKSLGNFVTIRLCLLKAHYRENVEYDEACLTRSREEWEAMRKVIGSANAARGRGTDGTAEALVDRTRTAFRDAMDDDLNTEDAVYSLQQFTEALRGLDGISADEGRGIINVYRECGRVLGLFDDLT
jgi:cysteinyl-tRNA synthetase